MDLLLYADELPKTRLIGLNVRNVSERRRETHSGELPVLPSQRLSWLRMFKNWLLVFLTKVLNRSRASGDLKSSRQQCGNQTESECLLC